VTDQLVALVMLLPSRAVLGKVRWSCLRLRGLQARKFIGELGEESKG
jgi:hypothetical protein